MANTPSLKNVLHFCLIIMGKGRSSTALPLTFWTSFVSGILNTKNFLFHFLTTSEKDAGEFEILLIFLILTLQNDVIQFFFFSHF